MAGGHLPPIKLTSRSWYRRTNACQQRQWKCEKGTGVGDFHFGAPEGLEEGDLDTSEWGGWVGGWVSGETEVGSGSSRRGYLGTDGPSKS